MLKKHNNINTQFFIRLAKEESLRKEKNIAMLYCDYIDFIKWMQSKFVLLGEESLQLKNTELQEIILDSYTYMPQLTLKERQEYILGFSIVLFVNKKINIYNLDRKIISQEVIKTLLTFSRDSQTISTLLGIKEGLTIMSYEYIYRKAK